MQLLQSIELVCALLTGQVNSKGVKSLIVRLYFLTLYRGIHHDLSCTLWVYPPVTDAFQNTYGI